MKQKNSKLALCVLSALLLVGCATSTSSNQPTTSSQETTSSATTSKPQSSITKNLTGIEISKMPKKVKYEEGDIFDKSGLEVKAKYSDNKDEIIKDYTIDKEKTPLKLEDKEVIISYKGFTASIKITVIEKHYDLSIDSLEHFEMKQGLGLVGDLKGEVLLSGNRRLMEGNDVDLSSLLIAMLRYLGYDANYVTDIVGFSEEQLMKWINTDSIEAATAIYACQGRENTTYEYKGVTYYFCDYTYVQVVDSGITYYLDVCFKEYESQKNSIQSLSSGASKSDIERIL